MDSSPTSCGVLEVRLTPLPGAAQRARALLAEHFAGDLAPRRLDDALLVAAELVTNAFRHGEGEIVLRAALEDGMLRIEVIDPEEGATPGIRPGQADATGGWGLHIVGALFTRWGAFEGTTHVWAELPVD